MENSVPDSGAVTTTSLLLAGLPADLSLHELQQPHHLRQRLHSLESDLQQTAIDNSRQFTQHHRTLHEKVIPRLQSMHRDLDCLINDVIPHLQSDLQSLHGALDVDENDENGNGDQSGVNGSSDERDKYWFLPDAKTVGRALSQRTSTVLMQLLEIPQLVETCIRQDMYSESLDLYDHVLSVTRSSGSEENNDLLRSIASQCHDLILQQLIPRLLSQLKDKLSLPQCLRLMSHMRRLWNHETWHPHLPESQSLSVLFLALRQKHLARQLQTLHQEGQFQQLSVLHAIDLVRQYCFDLSMQYQALFPLQEDMIPFALHMTMVVDDMLLDRHVRPHVDKQITTGEQVNRLADRLLHCGNTLARIGHEIRDHTIFEIVEQRLMSIMSVMLSSAIDEFRTEMEYFSIDSVSNDAIQSSDASRTESESENMRKLLHFPPLARVTNGFLRALNELRQCAPLSMRGTIVNLFEQKLGELHDIVMKRAPAASVGAAPAFATADSDSDRLKWNTMVHCLRVHCMDHIHQCLNTIYSDGQKSSDAKESKKLDMVEDDKGNYSSRIEKPDTRFNDSK